MMIAPIFARLSTRRQMMLRKSLVLVVSFTLRATPTAIAAGISEMESYSHHITFKQTAEQQHTPHVTYRDVFCHGKFGTLHSWLRDNLYRHGSKFDPRDLVGRVTGAATNVEPHLDYLREKYSELYQLPANTSG